MVDYRNIFRIFLLYLFFPVAGIFSQKKFHVMASVKFGLTYNGPELDPSILSAIKASTVEYSKDTHGFTYACIKTAEPTSAGDIEDAINDFNVASPVILFHPFFNEDNVVAIGATHFICKAISDQQAKHAAGKESTYSVWRLEDQPSAKKRKVDKYEGKPVSLLLTLLAARDAWLGEKNSQIASLQESLMSKDKEIESMDRRLIAKEDVVKAKDAVINELVKSKADLSVHQAELIRAKDDIIRAKQHLIIILRERDPGARCTCDDSE